MKTKKIKTVQVFLNDVDSAEVSAELLALRVHDGVVSVRYKEDGKEYMNIFSLANLSMIRVFGADE